MSTKSKRRQSRRHPEAQDGRHRALSRDDRQIAGELMSAILSALSFGALASEP